MALAGKLEMMRDSDQQTVEQAEVLINQGRYEAVIGDLTLVVSQEEDQAGEYAGCRISWSKWSEAIRAFSQSLNRNQTFIKAYEGLASLSRQERYRALQALPAESR